MNEKFGIKQNIDDINVKDIEGNNDNLIEENMEIIFFIFYILKKIIIILF